MKALSALLFLTVTSFSFAGSIELGSLEVPKRFAEVESRYVIDMEARSAKVAVDVSIRVDAGNGMAFPYTTTTMYEVPGLVMEGETLVLNTPERSIDCGNMGKTRIRRIPVLRLTGNCQVKTVVSDAMIDIALEYTAE